MAWGPLHNLGTQPLPGHPHYGLGTPTMGLGYTTVTWGIPSWPGEPAMMWGMPPWPGDPQCDLETPSWPGDPEHGSGDPAVASGTPPQLGHPAAAQGPHHGLGTPSQPGDPHHGLDTLPQPGDLPHSLGSPTTVWRTLWHGGPHSLGDLRPWGSPLCGARQRGPGRQAGLGRQEVPGSLGVPGESRLQLPRAEEPALSGSETGARKTPRQPAATQARPRTFLARPTWRNRQHPGWPRAGCRLRGADTQRPQRLCLQRPRPRSCAGGHKGLRGHRGPAPSDLVVVGTGGDPASRGATGPGSAGGSCEEMAERQCLRHLPLPGKLRSLALTRVGVITAPVGWGRGSFCWVSPASEGWCTAPTPHRITQSHGMVWVGKDVIVHLFPTPLPWAGTLPPAQGAPSPVQPGLEPCQGGGSHSCSGQPGPGPHHPQGAEFLPSI